MPKRAGAGLAGRTIPRNAFWQGSVFAFIATAFARDTSDAASTQRKAVADQIRPKVPKLATIMDEAEHDVLACMSFPKDRTGGVAPVAPRKPREGAKLHSTNPVERVNGEIKRRTEVVGPRAFLRTAGRNALDPK